MKPKLSANDKKKIIMTRLTGDKPVGPIHSQLAAKCSRHYAHAGAATVHSAACGENVWMPPFEEAFRRWKMTGFRSRSPSLPTRAHRPAAENL